MVTSSSTTCCPLSGILPKWGFKQLTCTIIGASFGNNYLSVHISHPVNPFPALPQFLIGCCRVPSPNKLTRLVLMQVVYNICHMLLSELTQLVSGSCGHAHELCSRSASTILCTQSHRHIASHQEVFPSNGTGISSPNTINLDMKIIVNSLVYFLEDVIVGHKCFWNYWPAVSSVQYALYQALEKQMADHVTNRWHGI